MKMDGWNTSFLLELLGPGQFSGAVFVSGSVSIHGPFVALIQDVKGMCCLLGPRRRCEKNLLASLRCG